MCVIVIKPKKVVISEEIMLDCWNSNPDGAGFAYIERGHVVISKGYMTFRTLMDAVNKVMEKQLVIHFRWATHGLRDAGNCHPFPVSYFTEDLRKTKLKTSVAIFHNGVIHKMKWDRTLSDSQVFIRDWMTFFSDEDLKSREDIEKTMKNTGSRFVMFFNDGTIKKIGTFYEGDNGIEFSNLNFIGAYKK